jgi:hypothetical protein
MARLYSITLSLICAGKVDVAARNGAKRKHWIYNHRVLVSGSVIGAAFGVEMSGGPQSDRA